MSINDRFAGTTLHTCPVAYRFAFHRGWVEAQNGQLYCREYDTAMSVQEQIGYECGRLVVTNVISARLSVPMWRGYKAGCELVEGAASRAAELVGNSLCGCAW